MTVFASIVVSFGCGVSLLSFVAVPSAGAPARYFRPEQEEELSDFPFEFSSTKGSKVTADNVLVQSVASKGDNVFDINEPQPIIRYKSSQLADADDADGSTDSGGKKNNRPTATAQQQQWTAKPTAQQQWTSTPTKKYSYSGKPVTMGGNQYVTTVYRNPGRREIEPAAALVAAAAADDDDVGVVVPSAGGQWDVVHRLFKQIYPIMSGIRIAYINK